MSSSRRDGKGGKSATGGRKGAPGAGGKGTAGGRKGAPGKSSKSATQGRTSKGAQGKPSRTGGSTSGDKRTSAPDSRPTGAKPARTRTGHAPRKTVHVPPPQEPHGDDDWEGRVLDLASPGDADEPHDGEHDPSLLRASGFSVDFEDGTPRPHTTRGPSRAPDAPPNTLQDTDPEDGPSAEDELDADEDEWADDEPWDGDLDEDPDGDAGGNEEDGASGHGTRARRPLVALVGRPNVGKSRLFNRMTGTRHAIVEDMPGVTRDRQYGDGSWEGRAYQVVDTGGFEPDTSDVLLTQMKEQAHIAMAEADIIVFVMDGHAGLMPADREIAQMLRRSDRVVIPVVNKIDGDRHEALVGEFHELGLPDLEWISAEHGRNYDGLMDRIKPHLPRLADVERTERDEIAIAVIGRPNAGKSTLINRLLGEERLLTSDIPGTTRDAVNTRIELDGKRYLFIDTAGVRRKRSIHEAVEKYSVVQAFKAIDRADVVLHVLDASEEDIGASTQDKRIAGMAHEKGRACVLLLNKWDAVEKDHRTADERVRNLREALRFNRYAPVVTISAMTGQRVHRILPLARQIHEQYTRRIGTSELNRVLREALDRNPPPTKGRRRLKIFYASQVSTGPPTIMLVVNSRELIHFSYERYLRNCLRRAFAFEGTPIKIFYRERAQRRGEPEPEGLTER